MIYQSFKDQSGEPSPLPCPLCVILTGKLLYIMGSDLKKSTFTNAIFNLLFRYLYTYKIGYTPHMEIQKIFKPLKNTAQFILTPLNGTTMIIYYRFF